MSTAKTSPKVPKNLKEFEQWASVFVCQCENQCLTQSQKWLTPSKEGGKKVCNKIFVSPKELKQGNMEKYDRAIATALRLFETHLILRKVKGKFYLMSKDKRNFKTSWENIKSPEIVEQDVRSGLWLLRKLIVDSLLRKILIRRYTMSGPEDIRVYSVGSTKITSDYDITVYSVQPEASAFVFEEFNKEFQSLFHESSTVVFDTNVYGKAFIYFALPQFRVKGMDRVLEHFRKMTLQKCQPQKETFYYFGSIPIQVEVCQLVWALVKLRKNLQEALGADTMESYFAFLSRNSVPAERQKKKERSVFVAAHHILDYLENQDVKEAESCYLQHVKEENVFLQTYLKSEVHPLTALTDLISVTNYWGVETYYTLGAFYDTVVNSQMCQSAQVPLSDFSLVCSILENTGFYFIHNNKAKYLTRVEATLQQLVRQNSKMALKLKKSEAMRQFTQMMGKICQTLPKDNGTKGNGTKGNGTKGLGSDLKAKSNVKVTRDCESKYCQWISETSFDLLRCEKFHFYQFLLEIVVEMFQVLFDQYCAFFFHPVPFERFFVMETLGKTTTKPHYESAEEKEKEGKGEGEGEEEGERENGEERRKRKEEEEEEEEELGEIEYDETGKTKKDLWSEWQNEEESRGQGELDLDTLPE